MSHPCPFPASCLTSDPLPRPSLRFCPTAKLDFMQRGQKQLPALARTGLRYFVHGFFKRSEDDDGLPYAEWATMRQLLRYTHPPTRAPPRSDPTGNPTRPDPLSS